MQYPLQRRHSHDSTDARSAELTLLTVQARIQADSKLASSLANDVDLNMDIVWDVLDQYKFAIVITRELDIESEAHALSRWVGHDASDARETASVTSFLCEPCMWH